jgi:YbbR domain-containing protein
MDKWLQNKNVVRVASVAMAILLWVVVHLDQQAASPSNTPVIKTRMISDVVVQIIGLDESQYHIRSLEPSRVSVLLRGQERDINRVSPNGEQGRVVLNLSGVGAGDHIISLQAEGFPAGVEASVYPAEAKVSIEPIQSQEMPVDIKLRGTPPAGWTVGEPLSDPRTVRVTAPESRLKQIVSIQGEVDISAADGDITIEKNLAAVDAEGNPVEAVIEPETVQVRVPVTMPSQVIPLHVEIVGEPADGFSVAGIRQNVSAVTVYGPPEVLKRLKRYDGATVDISGIRNDREFSVRIPLKENIQFVQPDTLEVRVDIVPSRTKQFAQVPVTVTGQSDKMKTFIREPSGGRVDITLEGAPQILEKIGAEDIRASADVQGLPAGVHEVPLRIEVPEFVKVSSGANLRITVEIASAAAESNTEPEEIPADSGNGANNGGASEGSGGPAAE